MQQTTGRDNFPEAFDVKFIEQDSRTVQARIARRERNREQEGTTYILAACVIVACKNKALDKMGMYRKRCKKVKEQLVETSFLGIVTVVIHERSQMTARVKFLLSMGVPLR